VRDPQILLRRLAYRVGYRVLRLSGAVLRLRTRGVKCVICRGDEVLLVRHTYGDRRRWELPGGGIKRREDALAAATREALEELGVRIEVWHPLGSLTIRNRVRNDRLSAFVARVGDIELRLDPGEIAEARWFPRAQLPPRRGAAVAHMVSLTR